MTSTQLTKVPETEWSLARKCALSRDFFSAVCLSSLGIFIVVSIYFDFTYVDLLMLQAKLPS